MNNMRVRMLVIRRIATYKVKSTGIHDEAVESMTKADKATKHRDRWQDGSQVAKLRTLEHVSTGPPSASLPN